jgi:hypothetical protein
LHGLLTRQPGAPEPPELAVAVNGVIRGTVGGYAYDESGGWQFWAFVGDVYEEGDNEVEFFEIIDGTDQEATLLPVPIA